jgi:hypothetical protein
VHDNVLEVALTIAALAEAESIGADYLLKVWQYRSLDRSVVMSERKTLPTEISEWWQRADKRVRFLGARRPVKRVGGFN